MVELPGYSIVRALGRGGMATVYLAEQRSLGRQVALKVLHAGLAADRHYVARFLREGRIAAGLHHRHIVAVHDVGEHEGTAFVAMEYLPRGSVPTRPMAAPEVLRLLREIGSALQDAHDAGIVHRDLKPDNILIHEDGAYMLSDFGIAWVRESNTIVTREGITLGTPEFMSPEQWRGLPLDGRADLYSLGVVMYQLLTGRLPYTGGDGWSIGMQHMSAPLPQLPPDFAALQPLLEALLAKEPADRVQSGADLVRRVEQLERGGAVPTTRLATPPATTPLPLGPPSAPAAATRGDTVRGRSIIGIALGALLLALLALALWPGAPPTSPAASLAILPFQAASTAADDVLYAEGMADELLDALAQVEGMTLAARASAYAMRGEGLDVRALGQRLQVAHILEATLRREGGQLRLSARLSDTGSGYTRWTQAYEVPAAQAPTLQRTLLVDLVRELLGREPDAAPALARAGVTADADAYANYLRARRILDQPTSSESIDAAVALFRAALDADPALARAQAGICSAEVRRFRRELDPLPLERARQACEQARAQAPDLADVDFAQGELAQARREHIEALTLFERAARDPALRPAVWLAAAASHAALGDAVQAQQKLEDARALQPGWWAVYFELGRFRLRQGDGRGAVEAFRTALDFRPERPIPIWNNLGAAYLASDDFEGAAAAFQSALDLGESASALSNLGTARFHLGQYDQAAALYRRACEVAPNDHRLWGNLGDALAAGLAGGDEAASAYGNALRLAEGLLAQRPGDAEMLSDLAWYHASLDHAGAARALIADLGAAVRDDAEVAFRVALVYARLGDADAARASIDAALAQGYSRRMLETTPLLRPLLGQSSD